MFEKSKYLEKLFELTEESAVKEIVDICEEVGFNPQHYTISIINGGISYTLESIASDLYLSRKTLCDAIRQKLFLFNIVAETRIEFSTIFRINDALAKEKGGWGERVVVEKKTKTIVEILKLVDQAYRNCDTCADHPNGCGGEDKDCCAPDYKDWREPK